MAQNFYFARLPLVVIIVMICSLISSVKGDLPDNFPTIKFTHNDLINSYDGFIFLTAFYGNSNYAIILDKFGNPYKWRETDNSPFNFAVQPNGLIAYSEAAAGKTNEFVSRLLDEELNDLDSFKCGNGYTMHPWEFRLLPNGHAIVCALESQPVNMLEIIPDGQPNARVTGSIIQELDKDKNVVFQWRSFDHIDITETYDIIKNYNFEVAHLNSVELDYDGNYIVSLRHLSQIIKIDRNSGKIIWRLGGKKNEFSFINENENNAPDYFSYQHDARRAPNGNLTFFDNGNLRHGPPYSRGVEYKLDEIEKTAELVWEYRRNPDFYASNRGSLQVLKNGNYLIGGVRSSSQIPFSTAEITPEGESVMAFYIEGGFNGYRTFKYALPACQPVAKVTKRVSPIDIEYNFDEEIAKTGVSLNFHSLVQNSANSEFTVIKYDCSPLYPEFEGISPLLLINRLSIDVSEVNSFDAIMKIDLSVYAKNLRLARPQIYFRETEGGGKFRELESEYIESENTLKFSVSQTGEFAIGQVFDNAPPLKTTLISPRDNNFINIENVVEFQWSPSGRYTHSRFELFKMQDGNMMLVKEKTLREVSLSIEGDELEDGSEYYWQVTSFNHFGAGETSSSYKFKVSKPFMRMLSPNGGEKINKDTAFILIKWEDNLDDTVKVELLKGGAVVHVINKSIKSPLNIMSWELPATIETGNDYKIRITNLEVDDLASESESEFSIIRGVDGVEEQVIKYPRPRVFPNPSNGVFTVDLREVSEQASATVYDIKGKTIDYVGDSFGSFYRIDLTNQQPGVYVLKINCGSVIYTEMLVKLF